MKYKWRDGIELIMGLPQFAKFCVAWKSMGSESLSEKRSKDKPAFERNIVWKCSAFDLFYLAGVFGFWSFVLRFDSDDSGGGDGRDGKMLKLVKNGFWWIGTDGWRCGREKVIPTITRHFITFDFSFPSSLSPALFISLCVFNFFSSTVSLYILCAAFFSLLLLFFILFYGDEEWRERERVR